MISGKHGFLTLLTYTDAVIIFQALNIRNQFSTLKTKDLQSQSWQPAHLRFFHEKSRFCLPNHFLPKKTLFLNLVLLISTYFYL